MKDLIGQRLEHANGQAGLCIDEWCDLDGVHVRVAINDWQHFACRADECRPARFKPYCIWTNPNKTAEMTA